MTAWIKVTSVKQIKELFPNESMVTCKDYRSELRQDKKRFFELKYIIE